MRKQQIGALKVKISRNYDNLYSKHSKNDRKVIISLAFLTSSEINDAMKKWRELCEREYRIKYYKKNNKFSNKLKYDVN